MGSRAAISVLVVLAALLAVAPASATTFPVTSEADSGPGTLRQAILDVNATAAGAPHTIQFSKSAPVVDGISLATPLPAITRDGTFVDGCGVGRGVGGVPNGPTGGACVQLDGGGTVATGLVVKQAGSVRIQDLRITGFSGVGVRLWGASSTFVAGNRFGLLADGTPAGNGRAIRVTGLTNDGTLVAAAKGNIIGGTSDAAIDEDAGPACDRACNLIANSSIVGIDLVGLAAGSGEADAPAGGDPDDLNEGTSISGNWIGIRDAGGTTAANAQAIRIGDAQQTTIGGATPEHGNVISGNTAGVEQAPGSAGASSLLYGVYGLSPDQNAVRPNGTYNVRLAGSAGRNALVIGVIVGPAPIGIDLTGPGSEVYGSAFRAPGADTTSRFTTAAIRLGAGADGSFIGANLQPTSLPPFFTGAPVVPSGCVALAYFFNDETCNSIGWIGPNAAGILVAGSDGSFIRRASVGGPLSGSDEIEGVPVKVIAEGADQVQGLTVGADESKGWNNLWRQSGPAVQVASGSTGVEVLGNGGISTQSPLNAGNRFTDLLGPAGAGNDPGTGANAGIQPPVVTQATIDGIAGTATPNATIRVIQQQRPVDADTEPTDPPPGFTYPPTETTVTANGSGVWGLTFPQNAVHAGQELLASQTVNGGTSEFAVEGAAPTEPDPVASFTSGPSGLVSEASATFTFVSDTPGSTFLCSLDAGTFTPCTSPHSVGPLEAGGHQLQVKAVDPLNTIGPPASRNWIIELPGQTTAPGTKTPLGASAGSGPGGSGGVNPSSASVALSSVVTFPSAKRCVSRRALKIRLKKPKGTGIAFVKIDVPGRATRTVRGKAISAPVNLRGLPRGRFTVRLRITLLDGRVVKGSRTFRTCAPKRR